jgi:hypothetical protein
MPGEFVRSPIIDALLQRGHPGRDDNWVERDPDYVAEYNLSAEHVPELIDLATRWDDDSCDTPAVYAPVPA